MRVRGFSFGVAAVLFAGIALGALDSKLVLPEAVWVLGLALFVYTTGLASGPGFVSVLRRRGLAANAVVLAVLGAAAGGAFLIHVFTGVSRASVAGAFAGGQTNTPALAALLESLKHAPAHVAAAPVVGYSLSYPLGVLLPLLAVQMVLKRRRAKLEPIVSRSVVVERPVAALGELRQRHPAAVTFGRIRHGGSLAVATDEVAPEPGDVLSVVGRPDDVKEVVAELGREARDRIELDRRELDFRRIAVSSRARRGTGRRDAAIRGEHVSVSRSRRARDDHVGPADALVVEPVRDVVGGVDAELRERLEHGGCTAGPSALPTEPFAP